MADVAREARVNRITVSRALSHPELVAEDTLERIRAAIARTGYVPNQIARGLKAEHSRIVSLITPPQMSGVYGAVLERLSAALYESGLIVNLFPVLDIEAQREAVLPELIGWKPAAIVIFGIQLTETARQSLLDRHTPVVELLNYRADSPDTCVGYDQAEATEILTDHLLDRGYRRIGYVHSANPLNIMNERRLSGFEKAITARKGTVRMLGGTRPAAPAADTWIAGTEIKCFPGFQAGYELMQHLHEHDRMPDALLYASDMVAVGALQYCLSHGLTPARDIGLCAVDGTELTSVIKPGLTSLDFPYERVVEYGAEQILRHVNDRTAAPERIRIPAKVLHRQTT
ncbi:MULTISPECIES: LacI family DNA-binding transcriptional regulator [unclassified Roseitalea]|uniref:LacI family DNA-binding transcriptional regulator n=1 Tax=unclassified Roseitalea TaxID=2639107 RepID=UPI0027401204|nr:MULTISPECIES: LacI family DNA-binding transcriptional regulator [unclassified Roseitalea]